MRLACARRFGALTQGGGERRQYHARLDRSGESRGHNGRMGDALRAEFRHLSCADRRRPRARQEAGDLDPLRGEVERVSLKLGRRLRFLVGKPGLDGDSNGAEQIRRAPRTPAWMPSMTASVAPAEIRGGQVWRPLRRPVDPVGLACRAHRGGAGALAPAGLEHVPLIVGDISSRRRGATEGRRRRGGLHAEGFRDQHHPRRGRPGGRGAI